MNNAFRILPIVAATVLSTAWAPALLAQGTPQVVTIPISEPGEPVTLEIDIISARIEVIGEDRDDAQFEFSVTDGQRHIVTPSGSQPLTGAGYELEIEEDDNMISVDTDWRADRVQITARVPRRANLYLDTVNDGEIIVSNITGELHLENTNGSITAQNVRGSVIAESVNEAITIGFAEIAGADNATALASLNGDLTLAIPENAGVRLHLDSGDGDIYSDFEVDVQPSQPVIEREEDEDGIQVRVESIIIADINGGGPVVRMKTLHGDIQIRKTEN